jgi:eukaryotic-like serine/threonine-protein kinase
VDSPSLSLTGLSTALAGRYDIEREIGRGGMATVYLARDLRHSRRVALKVLNPELGAVLGVERFLAEIRVTANLQHPNLLPLFDSGEADGLLFYVMPFVEGESLRAKLERETQFAVSEAVHIGSTLAGALDYAHRAGVIHRDLKPENVLMHEGQPLIADFGIALAVSNAGGTRITQTGLSLGTPQYMSPEQAAGDRVIDGRADQYSLGAIVYEMLVGEPPHTGNTAQAIIARLMTEKPRSIRTQRPSVPVHVEVAVEHALEKLAADRFVSVKEFGDALRGENAANHASIAARATGSSRARWLERVVLVGVAVVAIAFAVAARRAPEVPEHATRFALTLAQGMTLDNVFAPLNITPDGRTIIFRANIEGRVVLARRDLDNTDSRAIDGTDNAGWPIVSPNGKWLAFMAEGDVRKLRLDGGPSITVRRMGRTGDGIDWVNDDLLVGDLSGKRDGLYLLAANGGTLKQLTRRDTTTGVDGHVWPHVMADHKSIIFTLWSREGPSAARLAYTSIDDGKVEPLDIAAVYCVGYANGRLVYVTAEGTLIAQPFDLSRRKVTGDPVPMIQEINVAMSVGAARVALAQNGTLVYLPGSAKSHVVSVNETGAVSPLIAASNTYGTPAMAPDGHAIAMQILSSQGRSDVWIFDRRTTTLSRLTSDGQSFQPEWAGDGKNILYRGGVRGRYGIWSRAADGGGEPILVHAPKKAWLEFSASRDQKVLAYRDNSPARNSMSVVERGANGQDSVRTLGDPRFNYTAPQLSPDGKWIAYASNASVRQQVFVRGVGSDAGATQISLDGGLQPLWSADEHKLYYRVRTELWVATLALGDKVTVVERHRMFDGPFDIPGQLDATNYAVSPDGREFVMLRPLAEESKIAVVLNWTSELRGKDLKP